VFDGASHIVRQSEIMLIRKSANSVNEYGYESYTYQSYVALCNVRKW
jgi:hypothetical protein